MSRHWRWLWLALPLAAGCPALHSGYPDTRCRISTDCYEGEHCVDAVCVPGSDAPDAAMQQVDAAVQQDAATMDGP